MELNWYVMHYYTCNISLLNDNKFRICIAISPLKKCLGMLFPHFYHCYCYQIVTIIFFIFQIFVFDGESATS